MSARDGGYVALAGSRTDEVHEEAHSSPNVDQARVPLLPPSTAASTSSRHGGSGTLSVHQDGTYTYSYGPAGLAGLRYNYYALLCAFFASIGGLEFGYDQGVIANVLVMKDFVQRWPVSPLQKGIMTAVLELGALMGALFAGTYADRYSRGQAIISACGIFILGSIFQCAAQQLWHLFVGRAVGGIGVGALSMLSPLYMAEISPPEVRGSLLALEQLSIVLGVVFGFWTGFVTREIPSSLSWRIPLSIQLVPALILALGALFLPPSPRLLVLQGRDDDALRSLARLRLRTEVEAQGDVLLQIELMEMKVEARLVQLAAEADSQSHSDSAHTAPVLGKSARVDWKTELRSWKKLFGRKYRARTGVGVGVMVFQQWSGINALLYYGPTLIRSLGLTGDTVSLLVSGGIGIVQFVAVLPAIVWIDRVGRKPLLRGGSAIMAFSHLSIALLVLLFQADWPSHPIAAWAAVGGIYTFTFAYGTSFGPIGWVLPSEVFPLSMRSKGVALSTASNWFNNFLIGLITPVLITFSAPATFTTFATACFLAYLWSTYLIPETANISLEEMDEVFKSEVGREDRALKVQIEEELGLNRLIRELREE